MNDRKQHVIKTAHQLFIDKGFQSASIQDILDKSGISKGTFYNYFSSKNELLIALIKMIFQQLEQERNELLIGQNPANIEIFIKQIELQMRTSRANKLIALFEEVNFSNDVELKQFIKKGNLRMLSWLYNRFIDLFGEDKKPYLLDCATMFMGILQHNLRYYAIAYDSEGSIYEVVRYTVKRVMGIVEEVANAQEQLIPPKQLQHILPPCKNEGHAIGQEIIAVVTSLKENLNHSYNGSKTNELLDFIQDELLHSKKPRAFLISSALLSLKSDPQEVVVGDFQKLELLIENYYSTQINNS